MTDLDALDALVKSRGDQVCAHFRDDLDRIKRVASTNTDEWTTADKNLARFVLSGVVGLVIEGRI